MTHQANIETAYTETKKRARQAYQAIVEVSPALVTNDSYQEYLNAYSIRRAAHQALVVAEHYEWHLR